MAKACVGTAWTCLLLLLAACGSSNSHGGTDTTGSPTTSSSSATTTTAPTSTVTKPTVTGTTQLAGLCNRLAFSVVANLLLALNGSPVNSCQETPSVEGSKDVSEVDYGLGGSAAVIVSSGLGGARADTGVTTVYGYQTSFVAGQPGVSSGYAEARLGPQHIGIQAQFGAALDAAGSKLVSAVLEAVSGAPGAVNDDAMAEKGHLVMEVDNDYNPERGPDYHQSRPGGGRTGELTPSAEGLEVYFGTALPLPAATPGTYDGCRTLDWSGEQPTSWGTGSPATIPWSEMPAGSRFCFQETDSGMFIDLLTVTEPFNGRSVSASVKSWSCQPLEGGSGSC